MFSAKNIFRVAENALSVSPSLSKVVLMKQIPRYDPAIVDPLCIKPALSQLFNNTITEQWMNSCHKDKIAIGSHNIECSGAIKEARYRETKTGRFDGIHLIGSSGRKFYTLSVLNILRSSKLTSSDDDYHQSCAQYKYQEIHNRNRRQDSYKQKTDNDRNVNTQPKKVCPSHRKQIL